MLARMRAGQPCVSVNGNALSAWAFDAMNVLSWTDATGASAWLQLMVLPGGPVFMGTLAPSSGADAPGARSPFLGFHCTSDHLCSHAQRGSPPAY